MTVAICVHQCVEHGHRSAGGRMAGLVAGIGLAAWRSRLRCWHLSIAVLLLPVFQSCVHRRRGACSTSTETTVAAVLAARSDEAHRARARATRPRGKTWQLRQNPNSTTVPANTKLTCARSVLRCRHGQTHTTGVAAPARSNDSAPAGSAARLRHYVPHPKPFGCATC